MKIKKALKKFNSKNGFTTVNDILNEVICNPCNYFLKKDALYEVRELLESYDKFLKEFDVDGDIAIENAINLIDRRKQKGREEEKNAPKEISDQGVYMKPNGFSGFYAYKNPPYMLTVISTGWAGDFARELIGYAFGVLDEVMMDIDYARKERDMFWQEVYHGKAGNSLPVDTDGYDLQKYLCEMNDGTFYETSVVSDNKSSLTINLSAILPEFWEKIVIGRIKKWFSDKISICKGDSEIVMLFVSNMYHEVIKDYICHGKEV